MKYDWHVDNFLGFSLFRGLIFWFVLQLIWWLYDQHKSSYLPKYVQPCVKGLVPDHENCEYGIINNCIFGVFMNTLMSFCATSTRSTVEHFYSNLVSSSSDNPKHLWQTVNKLLRRKSSSPLPSSTPGISLADSFASFFTDKISNLCLSRSSNLTTSSPHLPSSPTTKEVWFWSYSHFASQGMCSYSRPYDQCQSLTCSLKISLMNFNRHFCHWIQILHVGLGQPSSLSLHFPLYTLIFYVSLSYSLHQCSCFSISIPSHSTRIAPLRFQAGCCRRRLNLALVFLCWFCVICIF